MFFLLIFIYGFSFVVVSGVFMDAISSMGYDYVASGHYANVIHPPADQMNEPSVLELSKDMVCMLDVNLLFS